MTARAFSRRTSSSIWRTSKGDEAAKPDASGPTRSEEHTSELQSRSDLVCRLLLEKKKKKIRLGSGYELLIVRTASRTTDVPNGLIINAHAYRTAPKAHPLRQP